MAFWYRGRQIKASLDDPRDWYVYRIKAKGCPVLYIGITTDTKRRFRQHQESFNGIRKLRMKKMTGPLQHVDARKVEIDLHRIYPHARKISTAWDYYRGL